MLIILDQTKPNHGYVNHTWSDKTVDAEILFEITFSVILSHLLFD